MELVSNNRHKESLEYALDVLFSDTYKQFIKSIYLYGSCARREQRYNSDVDLFIFTTKDINRSVLRSLRYDVIPENGKLPDVQLNYSDTDEFSSDRLFNSNLNREAKLIWVRN